MNDCNSIFLEDAIKCDPRLKSVYVNLREVMDLNNDIAYISGSVVEGFGNTTSDVDIYIVTGRADVYETKYVNSAKDGNYYVELNVFSKEQARQICDKINNTTLDDDQEIFNLSEKELEFYYRAAIGIPLFNLSAFNEFCSEFDKEKVNAIYERVHKWNAIKELYFVTLRKQNGEIELAYFHAQKAIEHALDSYLAKNGEGYCTGKYRFLKLKRLLEVKSDIYI